jgi:glycosyltransferase involved in cell wall biosynthesis
MKALGVETIQIKMRNPFDFRAAWQLSRECKKRGIDLIHAQYLRENYTALWSRIFNPRVRVMYTSHFIMSNNFILRVFNRILTPFEANVIAVCNKGKEMLISNGLSAKKISVIFNGVDPKLWSEPVKPALREELGIASGDFMILSAARFADDKGHHYLIDAMAELKKITSRPFKLVLAGDGPLLEDRKKQVSELGLEKDVYFIGFRKDMKNLFYSADLYINSSRHEALSFLMLEVLASGLPLIATDMGGNSDIINEQTKCGILVKYEDSRQLAETVLKVMEDDNLREELKANAFKAINERFNLDKITEDTYKLYLDSTKK